MIRYVCIADSIEMSTFLARSIPAFFFVSFFLQAISFKGAIEVKKLWVKRIKYLDFFYFLLLFFFAIAAFILSGQEDSNTKNGTWLSLSPLSKEFYSNNVDNLVVDFHCFLWNTWFKFFNQDHFTE